MSVWIAMLLIGAALLGAVVLIVAVPAFFGLVVWDARASRKDAGKDAEVMDERDIHDAQARIFVERNVARGFVLAGGVFWAIASFAGLYMFRDSGWTAALIGASIPLAAIAATLIIGWYYERVASVLLGLASVAVVAWGVIYQFEVGVWLLIGITLIGPMLTAAVLFWMARRDQDALELALSLRPELQLAYSEARIQ